MLTSATGIAEDADISAIVFWPDAIVLRFQEWRSGQRLACCRARKVADISATLLRPYHTLLLVRHHGCSHPFRVGIPIMYIFLQFRADPNHWRRSTYLQDFWSSWNDQIFLFLLQF